MCEKLYPEYECRTERPQQSAGWNSCGTNKVVLHPEKNKHFLLATKEKNVQRADNVTYF